MRAWIRRAEASASRGSRITTCRPGRSRRRCRRLRRRGRGGSRRSAGPGGGARSGATRRGSARTAPGPCRSRPQAPARRQPGLTSAKTTVRPSAFETTFWATQRTSPAASPCFCARPARIPGRSSPATDLAEPGEWPEPHLARAARIPAEPQVDADPAGVTTSRGSARRPRGPQGCRRPSRAPAVRAPAPPPRGGRPGRGAGRGEPGPRWGSITSGGSSSITLVPVPSREANEGRAGRREGVFDDEGSRSAGIAGRDRPSAPAPAGRGWAKPECDGGIDTPVPGTWSGINVGAVDERDRGGASGSLVTTTVCSMHARSARQVTSMSVEHRLLQRHVGRAVEHRPRGAAVPGRAA